MAAPKHNKKGSKPMKKQVTTHIEQEEWLEWLRYATDLNLASSKFIREGVRFYIKHLKSSTHN